LLFSLRAPLLTTTAAAAASCQLSHKSD